MSDCVRVRVPRHVREAVAQAARDWPKTVDAATLLTQLNALAELVYALGKRDADTTT